MRPGTARSRLPAPERLAAAALVAAVALLLAACPRDPTGGFLMPFTPVGEQVFEDEFEALGIRFSHAPVVESVAIGGEVRPAVLSSPAGWTWRGQVPAAGWLQVGVQLTPEAWQEARAVEARVALRHQGERQVLESVRAERSRRPEWLGFGVDLSPWAGEAVTLEFSASVAGPAGLGEERPVAWGPVALYGREAAARRGGSPGIVLVVVGGLRADRLGASGEEGAVTPGIDRVLLSRGASFDDAYAQAPWTVPSVVSLLSGRHPGEVLRGQSRPPVLPAEVPTLAERLRQAGYHTAAYVGDRELAGLEGLSRGFDTWLGPSEDFPGGGPSASVLAQRALDFLQAHAARPFFLYLHLPDIETPGPVRLAGGEASEAAEEESPAEAGAEDPDPVGEHERFTAYDAELRRADRAVAELLDVLDPRLLGRHLVVLTADHAVPVPPALPVKGDGGDAGAQEVDAAPPSDLANQRIHVPLVFRWDGRVRERLRVAGSVRLLDVAPTVLSAADLELVPELDGIDLLPTLVGIETLPRSAALAEALGRGPLSMASILDEWKLILSNPGVPEPPVQLFDLGRDREERQDLAAAEPERVEQLAALIHAQLDNELAGLRVVLDDVAPGRRVTGELVFASAPGGWAPYFLAADDEVTQEGNRVRFDLVAGLPQKGFLVLGDPGAVERLTVRVGAGRVSARRVLVGRGDPYRGGRITPAQLRSSEWPFRAGVPVSAVLRIWRPASPPGVASGASAAAAAGTPDGSP
ncbi:MAG TPA: sulfatase [Thermoanaerobaculia bacterium]|nr:sulfatase [Thermoanaerobaculia bacterium]